MRVAKAMTPRLLDIQHGALQGRDTNTVATKLLNELHTQDGYVALLHVAKAFPSVPLSMLSNIVKEAGAPASIIKMPRDIYHHTAAVPSLHGRGLPIRPTRGMKEVCPLSPTLLLYYDILPRETKERRPEGRLQVFVHDVAARAPTSETLLQTLVLYHPMDHTRPTRVTKQRPYTTSNDKPVT